MRIQLNLLTILFLSLNYLSAQELTTPATSPRSHLQQTIGYTSMELDYSRPQLRGRTIFGSLIPYGEIWRLGANASTKLHIDRPVKIGGKSLGPGTFALYAIPGEENWTWIVNSDTSLLGAYGYKQVLDVVRENARVESLPERIQTMEFRLMNIQSDRADLVLEWEYTRVRLPILFSTKEDVAQRIREVLGDQPGAMDYYWAGRYYYEQGMDLEQALEWMDKSLALEHNAYGALRYKALIEAGLGERETARKTMERSLELARTAKDGNTARMNEQDLHAWTKSKQAIGAGELLARSIAYHDPDTLWGKARLQWHFFEDRPSGSYRLSYMDYEPLQDRFRLTQQVGRNTLYREVHTGNCMSKLNGDTVLTKEEINEYRLNCERNTMYRDYYTYLWGMPMKLHDPGTQIDPEVYQVQFFGQDLLEIRVTYDPDVGSDIWYFYFDPKTYAMKGYRFYHDEAANDGEYILLDGEVELNGMNIPAKRTWYTHKDNRVLGTDELLPHSTVLKRD